MWCLAFSGDGKWLASGGQDQALKLWDGANGNGVRTFGGIPQAVVSLAFSKDGTQLAAGTWDGVTRLFNPANGQLLKQLPAPEPEKK